MQLRAFISQMWDFPKCYDPLRGRFTEAAKAAALSG